MGYSALGGKESDTTEHQHHHPQCSLTVLEILGPLRVTLRLFCLCSLSGTTKLVWQHTSLQHGLLNILSLFWRPAAQEKKKKKISFRILLLIDKAPGDSRALMEMYKEINVVFMPASTSSFCSPWIRRNFEFQVYHWRNTFCKTLTSRDSGSSDESGQNKIKIF